jgi:hypothetical protein
MKGRLQEHGGLVMTQHNNGMHPTADTTALIFGNLLGRRVMPSVRRASHKREGRELEGSE